MSKKLLIFMLCFMSSIIAAGEITKTNLLSKSKSVNETKNSHKIYIKNGLDKKLKIGKYTIVLTRIDDKMNRIHLKSIPRNISLIVEAFDRAGKKMKTKAVGENLSTNSTSNHKYMYKSIPEYLVIK